MVSEAPPFWWKKRGWQAFCLAPAALVYGSIAAALMRHRRRHALPVPVICVGNFTVGGAGKTPTAITIAKAAIRKGLKPGFLSRGYGGSLDVTTLVDPHHHRSTAVGDEPLLLARVAPTVISRRRIAGANMLVSEGVDLIIMDDGFQSARLIVDYAVIVLDSVRGMGNGCIVPAGPVRAPVSVQIQHLNTLLKVGRGDAADQLVRHVSRMGKPVMVAQVAPQNAQIVKGKPVLAYAGIADPAKFYRSLEEAGAVIRDRQGFPDHHHLADDEIADLLQRAQKQNLQLVTTDKDYVRLAGQAGLAKELAQQSLVLEIHMVFDDPAAPDMIIDHAIAACRLRRLAENRRN